jgi:hypothetical protein
VLQIELQLTTQLDDLRFAGKLKAHTAVSRALPPLTQQTLAHELVTTRVENAQGVPALLQQLGFSAADVKLAQTPW